MTSFEKHVTEDLIGPFNEVEKKFAPDVLFLSGQKEIVLKKRKVSVIGTRNPTNYGIAAARKITTFLVHNEIVVVSGLAKGIDTIAHKTALNNGGYTIAVIGTSLDTYYPAQNRELQKTLMEKQLVISQFQEGTTIYRSNFPLRNRTMALISTVSIIVEAGEKSGTEHQGWEALRLGRQLFIAEHLVQNKNLKWPQKLIEYGAEVLYLDKLEHILEYIPEEDGEVPLNAIISPYVTCDPI